MEKIYIYIFEMSKIKTEIIDLFPVLRELKLVQFFFCLSCYLLHLVSCQR